MIAYDKFLERKRKFHIDSGFDVKDADLHHLLFDFQRYCVRWALAKGRAALFEDCGLGKTFQQLEWCKQVNEFTGGKSLICAPFAVVEQTKKEAVHFGYEMRGIDIINYEQIDNIDCAIYAGVVLDESSILKNFEGAYRNLLIDKFAKTPYKLCCTATPSPNDPMELGNHSEFLNIMSRNEMLSKYFVHDGGDTGKWRIKKHAVKEFWSWVASWAIMICKPSDIGFSDEGYVLPELRFIEKRISTKQREGKLFNDIAVSATNFNSELRLTKVERLSEVAEIVNGSSENFIIWVKQNEEADELKRLIPDAIEVRGTDDPEYKKETLIGFAENKFRVLLTKTKIAALGMNFQNCHNQIFASLDFSFEQLYQGIRRSYRFMQQHPVSIYLITTDTMQNVIESIKKKQKQFELMQHEMTNAVSQEQGGEVIQSENVLTDSYHVMRGDCCELIRQVPDESIGFSIFSPPFADLYT